MLRIALALRSARGRHARRLVTVAAQDKKDKRRRRSKAR